MRLVRTSWANVSLLGWRWGHTFDLRSWARFVKRAKYVRSATLSPTGARAAFDIRGDIITVPAEKGDDRNLTGSAAVHERFPAWSPDGTKIAWFSDEWGGERRRRLRPPVVAPEIRLEEIRIAAATTGMDERQRC